MHAHRSVSLNFWYHLKESCSHPDTSLQTLLYVSPKIKVCLLTTHSTIITLKKMNNNL